ncbi:MAG: tRNA (cytosine(48)-C(5))-methyltransferase [Promethearchaeota archaeon]|nr:MAG: tRNA (cytosine(48)-C(5))-methyltransferase [Candidatus Lokiarchaeota archaeon]
MISINSDHNQVKTLATNYGYLPYMIQRYIDFLGIEETINLLEANEKPLNPWIRMNSLKISSHNLVEKLQNKEVVLRQGKWLRYAFEILNEPIPIGSLHEYLQGFYYIQNKLSMLPPHLLNPTADDTVIDMCAAPGGKASHLAQLMENKGILLLIERNKKRIPALELNLNRMGIYNSIIVNMDARNLDSLNTKADKILLDAPCTGEGLIREDPSRKKSKTPQNLQKMAQIQKELLSSGLDILRKNGHLLYSTCSIAPEENELVVNYVLNQRKDAKIIKIEAQYGVPGFIEIFGAFLREDLRYSQRFFPHLHNSIGFYICLIKKI